MTFSGIFLYDSADRSLNGFNNRVLFSLFWFLFEDVSVKERINDWNFDYLIFQKAYIAITFFWYCICTKLDIYNYYAI